jgi:hypothetical protein
MRKVNFTGKVIFISPVREFTTKSGDVGKVVNLIVADETSNVKVVLWDLNHISLIESGEVSLQDSVEIVSGNMRDSEVHLGSFSEFKKSNKTFGEVKTKEVVKEKNIAGLVVGEKVKLRAFIVQSFDPRFFEVNPETGRKITEEELASGVPTEKRAILNCVLDDGTDSIRAVMFHENVQKTGVKSFDNPKMLEQEKMNLLGKEFYFVGNVRKNSYFQNTELIVDSLEEVKAEKLLEKLENQ